MDNSVNNPNNDAIGTKVTSPRASGNLTSPSSYMYTSSASLLTQREKPPILPKYQGYASGNASSSYRLTSSSGRPKLPDTLTASSQPGDTNLVRFASSFH